MKDNIQNKEQYQIVMAQIEEYLQKAINPNSFQNFNFRNFVENKKIRALLVKCICEVRYFHQSLPHKSPNDLC